MHAWGLCLLLCFPILAFGQHSVAREWNEVLLEAIREDQPRPMVHARNLFHTSVALYDAWAAYDTTATTFLLGNLAGGYAGCTFEKPEAPADPQAAREEAMSYATYRVLKYRFEKSPGAPTSLARFDSLLLALGFDPSFTSTDYESGLPGALGNYLGDCIISFGHHDYANEQQNYGNLHYHSVNPSLVPALPGNALMTNPNRWQSLALEFELDSAGQVVPGPAPQFLGPEWGHVTPFALSEDDLQIHQRDGQDYWVYLDPGAPPYLQNEVGGLADDYKWNFALVSAWSAHLDPTDGVMWDISPASIGNLDEIPPPGADLREFYDLYEGGDPGQGHSVNPYTDAPYTPQIVPRGDYTRTLAEFWADGPNSETPPGHWYTILNYVSDHPLLAKRYRGEGPLVGDLEWDVKAYFTLGGAVNDAAIAAWGIKGWYDYVRPISAIRYLADQGQSSDSTRLHFSADGMPLIPGLIELVEAGDSLAGAGGQHIGKIKIYGWRGPQYITAPTVETAGVGWILAENWWPFQGATSVTPPFAGYISGHSTFSRAAAEVLTLLTGDAYFPGGMGEFHCEKNEFLLFEEGPSEDVTLQWATYRDASDQTSLSRIWGGIHPPADDLPGRRIGEKVGQDAFGLAEQYFLGKLATAADEIPVVASGVRLYPNPIVAGTPLVIAFDEPFAGLPVEVFNVEGQRIPISASLTRPDQEIYQLDTRGWATGLYFVRMRRLGKVETYKIHLIAG